MGIRPPLLGYELARGGRWDPVLVGAWRRHQIVSHAERFGGRAMHSKVL